MSFMAEPIVSAVAAPVEHREPESLEFPGCRPVRITCDEMDDCEDRFEYWDGGAGVPGRGALPAAAGSSARETNPALPQRDVG